MSDPTPEQLRELADRLEHSNQYDGWTQVDHKVQAAEHLRSYASFLQEKTLNAGVAPERDYPFDNPNAV